MNEKDFKSILAEICEEEISELNKFPPFKPSLRHRFAMKRIFAAFEKNTCQAAAVPAPSLEVQRTHKRPSARLAILFAIIVCAALFSPLLSGFVVIYTSESFRGVIYPDHTDIHATDTEGCLTTIEYEYYLPEVPEGFEIADKDVSKVWVFTDYKNKLSEQYIFFVQFTKDTFVAHCNTEYYDFEEIEINGHNGLCIDESNYSYIVWDNGDYILEIYGGLNKNAMMNLAKTAKILKN